MGFLDRFRSWLATESAEARDLGRDTKHRLEADLEQREAELAASPSEKLDMLQQEIADSDSSFDQLRDRIEGRSAHASAVEELTDENPDGEDQPEDS